MLWVCLLLENRMPIESKQLEPIMGSKTIMRNSNIELLRIVAMLAIIAHHYVVNSTVTTLFDPMHPTANSIFLQLWESQTDKIFYVIQSIVTLIK